MKVTCPNPKCQCSFDVPSRDVIKSANQLKGKRNNKPVGEVPDDIGNRIATSAEPEWSQQPPVRSGTYWHWNGDYDSGPLPIFVMWSGTNGKCFVSMGQLGLTHAIDCDEYGGWWKELLDPALPE